MIRHPEVVFNFVYVGQLELVFPGILLDPGVRLRLLGLVNTSTPSPPAGAVTAFSKEQLLEYGPAEKYQQRSTGRRLQCCLARVFPDSPSASGLSCVSPSVDTV